jgi:hypothetical protein
MIRVTIEILPFGYESQKRELGSFIIYNTGDHELRPEYGNYKFTLEKDNKKYRGSIKDFSRNFGWLYLLKTVIEKIIKKVDKDEKRYFLAKN